MMIHLSDEADTLQERLLLLHIRATTQYNFRLRPTVPWMKYLDRAVYCFAGLVLCGMAVLSQIRSP